MHFKTFVHDKMVVFMSLLLFAVALLCMLLVLLRVDTTQPVAIIRNNTTLGLAGFEKVSTTSLYRFAFMPLIFSVVHIVLAMRVHQHKKQLAVLVIGLGVIVNVFALVVSSAILGLHR